MRSRELEWEQAQALLTTIGLTPHPQPLHIDSINVRHVFLSIAVKPQGSVMRLSSSFVSRLLQVLLGIPEVRSKALLSGSSLVYQLCRRSQTSCSELPQIQAFKQALEETLKESSKDKKYSEGHTVGVSSRI